MCTRAEPLWVLDNAAPRNKRGRSRPLPGTHARHVRDEGDRLPRDRTLDPRGEDARPEHRRGPRSSPRDRRHAGTLDNDDHVNNLTASVDLLRAIRNTDVRVAYDFSDSNNSFVHGGPRIAALTAINQFIPLPEVDNRWHRLTADVQYFFSARAGVGVGYYFETLDVSDFNTIDTDGPVGFPETPAQMYLHFARL